MNGLTIGQVAASAHVTRGTIRYYEQVGVVPPPRRTPAGYRQYDAAIVHRLRVIRNAQDFGFSLRQIASFLRARDGGGQPCQRVRLAAEGLLSAVDAQIAALVARRSEMADVLRLWDERLARTPPNQRAHLLETLGDRRPSSPAPRLPKRRKAMAT